MTLHGTNKTNHLASNYDEDEEFYVIGDRVYVDGYRPGSVAYFGETEFGSGDWVGVVLDEPTGNHDGKLHGREYFQCAPNHGVFVRTHRVSQMSSAQQRSSRRSHFASRTPTPTPTYNHLLGNKRASLGLAGESSRCSSKSPANSLLDSYYYDDDYRQSRAPTIDSLARKLKSIDEQQERSPRDRWPLSSTTPTGILKQRSVDWTRSPGGASSGLGSSQHDLTSSGSMGSRMNELDRRPRANSMSPAAQRRSVFNFRPKREPWTGAAEPTTLAPLTDRQREYDNLATNESAARRHCVNLSSEPPELGDRVWVRTERHARERELSGVLRFMGETEFATGEWAGVELDEPSGKNDGSILGHRYFYCPQGYGLFVPATRIRKRTGDGPTASALFDSMRSTITSPPPPQPPRRQHHFATGSGSSAATPSSGYELSGNSTSASPFSRSSSVSYSPAEPASGDSEWRQRRRFPAYVSRATSISPPRLESALADRHYNRPTKFDDRDLERELEKSLKKQSSRHQISAPTSRAKAVTYTFITNKYQGNPIAKRTLVYE